MIPESYIEKGILKIDNDDLNNLTLKWFQLVKEKIFQK
jgi:hypothetical protein